MYLPQRTWLQTAKGMGQAPGDPGFVGPLTADQQMIQNLTAAVNYRDALLSQQPTSSLSAFLQQYQGPLLVGGLLLFGLAAMRR